MNQVRNEQVAGIKEAVGILEYTVAEENNIAVDVALYHLIERVFDLCHTQGHDVSSWDKVTLGDLRQHLGRHLPLKEAIG